MCSPTDLSSVEGKKKKKQPLLDYVKSIWIQSRNSVRRALGDHLVHPVSSTAEETAVQRRKATWPRPLSKYMDKQGLAQVS